MWQECGIVKFFDERGNKRYGFIRVLDSDGNETGEEIFFHFNDGELIDTVLLGEIIFRGSGSAVLGGKQITIDPPRKGDKIFFHRKDGKEGKPKACPWGAAKQQYLWGPDHPTIAEVLEEENQPTESEEDHIDKLSSEDDCLAWDEEEDEDPLAGDVEPTGGYYEPSPDPFEAQHLRVMAQHGDYTNTIL